MRLLLPVLLWLSIVPCLPAQGKAAAATAWTPPDGILHAVRNARVAASSGSEIQLTRGNPGQPIELAFSASEAVGVSRDRNQWWVIPTGGNDGSISANRSLWVLPMAPESPDSGWWIEPDSSGGSPITAEKQASGVTVLLQADSMTLHKREARPHSDVLGNRYALTMRDGKQLEDTLAAFYWGTILPSVVEKTIAARFPYSDGYVLSTLETTKYMGSYPAVDHEFQIHGRLAIGSPADLDVVRRMLGLQFLLMDDDPQKLSRAPTSVQPDGRREYHIRRNSEDNRENAAMFPVTGNIEVLAEAADYFDETRDRDWLDAHIGNLERAAGWVSANTDQYGRVWSDVYYEDQVIKDGRVTQAQAFAAHAFERLAEMEGALGRAAQVHEYRALSRKLATVLVQALPVGYWDVGHQRFVDWVDRNGVTHDHVHLLANTLPVTFGYATVAQAAEVRQLVEANAREFERFPSFLSADIAAYTPSEIGSAGPYDLCAAGRYWYWDAAFRASQKQNAVLLDQLLAVAAEARKSDFYMGERYDMDHVYYVDGKNAHGVGKYYEYPNVFAAVLIEKYAGLALRAGAGVTVAPHLALYGAVEFDTPAYALRYRWDRAGFTLDNLSNRRRSFDVDLSGIATGSTGFASRGDVRRSSATQHFSVTLAPHAHATWVSIVK